MVEKTTGDGDLQKALEAAGKVAKGLSNVRGDDAATYATPAAAPDELAEAALKFIAEQPNRAKTPKDDANRQEALQLLMEIRGMDAEVRAGLKFVEAQLYKAVQTGSTKGINLDTIRAAIENAQKTTETSKAESPQAKVDRLWGEIKEFNKKIDDKFEELESKGAIFDDEDKKKREELKKRAAEGDVQAQKELEEHEKQMLEKLRKNQPELTEEISEVEKLLQKRAEAFKELLAAKKALGELSKEKELIYKEKFVTDTEKLKTSGEGAIANSIAEYERQRAGLKNIKDTQVNKGLVVVEATHADEKQPAASPLVATKPQSLDMT